MEQPADSLEEIVETLKEIRYCLKDPNLNLVCQVDLLCHVAADLAAHVARVEAKADALASGFSFGG